MRIADMVDEMTPLIRVKMTDKEFNDLTLHATELGEAVGSGRLEKAYLYVYPSEAGLQFYITRQASNPNVWSFPLASLTFNNLKGEWQFRTNRMLCVTGIGEAMRAGFDKGRAAKDERERRAVIMQKTYTPMVLTVVDQGHTVVTMETFTDPEAAQGRWDQLKELGQPNLERDSGDCFSPTFQQLKAAQPTITSIDTITYRNPKERAGE